MGRRSEKTTRLTTQTSRLSIQMSITHESRRFKDKGIGHAEWTRRCECITPPRGRHLPGLPPRPAGTRFSGQWSVSMAQRRGSAPSTHRTLPTWFRWFGRFSCHRRCWCEAGRCGYTLLRRQTWRGLGYRYMLFCYFFLVRIGDAIGKQCFLVVSAQHSGNVCPGRALGSV